MMGRNGLDDEEEIEHNERNKNYNNEEEDNDREEDYNENNSRSNRKRNLVSKKPSLGSSKYPKIHHNAKRGFQNCPTECIQKFFGK